MAKTFFDYDTEAVSFYSAGNITRVTSECGISTNEIACMDRSTQSVSIGSAEMQTENQCPNDKPKYQEDALLEFMRRVAPKVENELRKRSKYFGSDFVQNISDEDDTETKKILDLKTGDRVKEMYGRHISWNSYSNKIVVNFSYLKHESWCKHTSYILIYECDKNDEFKKDAEECIEVNTCVVDVKFHPILNYVLVFATDEGRIYWHNIAETTENNSQNYISLNDEKITQLSWVELNTILYLVVSGSDGLLYLYTTAPFVSDWKLMRKFVFKNSDDSLDRGILCFDFSPLNTRKFVVALEGSLMVHCRADAILKISDEPSYAVVSHFESTHIVNGIRFSLFEENVFVTSSTDQQMRIYRLNEVRIRHVLRYLEDKSPIHVICVDYIPLGIKWSYLLDNAFETWTVDGEIRVYDYRKCVELKNIKLSDKLTSLACTVKGMKQLLAIVDSNSVSIWQTALIAR